MTDHSNNFDSAQHSVHAGADTMKKMSDMSASAMSEFTKMFSNVKMPMMPDMDLLMSAHRRNLETLSAANKVALEGAQAVARRNMEIMQQTMAELTDNMRHFAANEPPQAKAARQADMLRAAYERAVHNMQEISGLIQKSNGEALGLLNHRFAEAVDEVKSLVAKSAQPGV
jgi:phasin family protein